MAIFSRASRGVSTGAEERDVIQAGLPGGNLFCHDGDGLRRDSIDFCSQEMSNCQRLSSRRHTGDDHRFLEETNKFVYNDNEIVQLLVAVLLQISVAPKNSKSQVRSREGAIEVVAR